MVRFALLLVLAGCTCPRPPGGWKPPCRTFEIHAWSGPPAGYVVRDEPYWRCDAGWCDEAVSSVPPGVDVHAVEASLLAEATAAHTAGKRYWVNFSAPEIRMIVAGEVPYPAFADEVSFDFYKGMCRWEQYRGYAERLRERRLPHQKLGMVVEGRDPDVVKMAVSWVSWHGEFTRVVVFGSPDYGPEWPMDPEAQKVIDEVQSLPECH